MQGMRSNMNPSVIPIHNLTIQPYEFYAFCLQSRQIHLADYKNLLNYRKPFLGNFIPHTFIVLSWEFAKLCTIFQFSSITLMVFLGILLCHGRTILSCLICLVFSEIASLYSNVLTSDADNSNRLAFNGRKEYMYNIIRSAVLPVYETKSSSSTALIIWVRSRQE